ncbi:NADH dehydrogenase [ubiquinone] iron-sulfur protein 6, mitochondrial [Hyla sarda]|uniref:NADH dehydrogenase [ubiquinone] iron-sulfur protein 6, mitochondrial n=1 Tax=Hyla sarda TaxID=327740 RepID=UPI0024C2834C|nr:NADH dehydrogenase [ubiquinone] iron-sulfur protein 6, mitochondrial [Hyla sarda]
MASSWLALLRGCVRGIGGKGLSGSARDSLCVSRSLACGAELTQRQLSTAVSTTGEKVTHTGQVFDEGDYRKVRFVGKQKEINEQFAINLIAEQPVNEAKSRIVSCDGGGGALGHPRVYINLDKETKTGTCGYCGLQFKQKPHH